MIEDILEQLDIPYITEGSSHCREGWVQINCLFCSSAADNKWHLGYNIEGAYWNCWRCGHHSAYNVFIEYGAKPGRAYDAASKLSGTPGEYKELYKESNRLELPASVGELTKRHSNYLKARGFDHKEICRLWNVQGIGLAAKLAWRLFIPVYYKGRIASWTTRSISPAAKLRYISASPNQERLPLKSLLYGVDYCTHSIIIAEGPTDVWRVGPGCVATFGLSVTQEQINKMIAFPYRYVCFDNSKDAQERAHVLADTLSLFDGETHVISIDSEDLGVATKKEVANLRRLVR